MQSGFYIKYSSTNDYSIKSLGQSLIGLEKNIHSAMKMYGMTSDVDLKIKKVSEGSIIFDIFIDLVANNVVELFSNDIHLYLDFLLVVNKTLYNTIISENILNGYISLEHFVAKHPVAYDVAKRIGGGIISFFVAAKVIKNTTININTPLISINQNVNITKNQAQYIQKSIEKGEFQELLLPITEDNIENIEFGLEEGGNNRVPELQIDETNFESYLSQGSQILPHLVNGQQHILPGKITSMQVNKGESMHYNIRIGEKEYSLILKASDGDSIDNYKMFFNQDIVIQAEVVRDSLYKKPKLVLKQIQSAEMPLLSIENTNK